jgi:hypothetical protein
MFLSPAPDLLSCRLLGTHCTDEVFPERHLLLLALEIVQQNTSLLALLTPIPHNDARAVNNLPSITLTIQNAKTGPLAQLLSIGHLDERDLVLGAQGNDEFLVGFFFAGFVEDAHVCLATVEGFGGFAQAAGKTVVN